MYNKWRIRIILVSLVVLAILTRQAYYAGKWRWYENKQSGFALAYPASWFPLPGNKLPTSKYVDLFVMDVPVLYKIELRVYSSSLHGSGQSIYYPSFGAWIIRENNDKNRIVDIHKTISVGNRGYQGEEVLYENDRFRGRIVSLTHNGKVYAVEISAVKQKWEEANIIFDQILETFVFLE